MVQSKGMKGCPNISEVVNYPTYQNLSTGGKVFIEKNVKMSEPVRLW